MEDFLEQGGELLKDLLLQGLWDPVPEFSG
jgi:hypothetical protein